MAREQKRDKLIIVKNDAIVLIKGNNSKDVVVCAVLDGHLDLGVYDNTTMTKAVKMACKCSKYQDKKYVSVAKFDDRAFVKTEGDKLNYEAVGIEEFMDTLQIFDIREYSNMSIISNDISKAENSEKSNIDIVEENIVK